MQKRNRWILVAVIVGAAVVVYPYSRGQGYIKIDTPGVELQLRSGWFASTTINSYAQPVRVKARVYRPERAVITVEKKQEGKWWSLLCRNGPWGELARIKVARGKTTVLKLGPPFTVHTDVRRRGRDVSLGLSLVGQAGARWIAQVLASDRRRAAEPTVQILDESGKVLASGKFEYG